ncbi:MAG: YhgE/Pip domain-containing protein [Bifidobacterium angulatum]
MGNVFAILARDFKRLLKVPSAWVVAIGLVLIPPMYAWFNIRGFWNPYHNTKGIEVTVVNNDQGTTNKLIGNANLGAQIVAQLKNNDQLGWNFADEQEGMTRVRSGESYATIVIPKTFSKDLVDTITGTGNRPELKYYVNEKVSAIAPKITDTGAGTVDTQVNSTFVSTVSEVLSDALNTLNGTISTTAGTIQTSTVQSLDEAQSTIASARGRLATIINTMDETPATTKAARQSLSSLQQAAVDAGNSLTATSTLITTAQNGINDFAATTSTGLDQGTALLTQSMQQATTTINTVTTGLSSANATAGNAVSTLQTVNDNTASVLETLSNLPLASSSPELKAAIAQLKHSNTNAAETLRDIQALNTSTGSAITTVSDLGATINNAAQQSLDSTSKARSAITSGALPQLNNGLGSLAGAAGTLGGGLSNQTALASQANVMLDQLDKASADTASALRTTDKALAKLSDKLSTVATDITALNTSAMLSSMLGTDGNLDTKRIATFMLSPTVLDTTVLYPVNSYGSGMAPLFTNMALWVGAFALVVIFKTEADGEGITAMTATQGYMGRFLFLSVFAALQGFATTVGDLLLGVQTVNAAAFVLTGVLTSLVDLSLIFALSTAFLHVGKGVCVALIMLQIPGASGLYPIEMMPKFFRTLYPFFPFNYSIKALRETIGGFYDGHWLQNIVYLLLFTVIGFIIGLVIRPLMANTNRMFARQIREGGMIVGEDVHLPGTEYRISNALQALTNHSGYKASIERRIVRFEALYPKLKRGALIVGLVVPIVLAVTFSLTTNTKLEALLAWIIWVLLIIGFLLTIEFMRDSLRRQRELGNLDDIQIRDALAVHERRHAR